MGSYIISRTEADPVRLFLVQGKELAELQECLKTEGYFSQFHIQLWEMKPSPTQQKNGCGLVTLNELTLPPTTMAEEYLRRALWYARLDGSKDESEVLSQFARIILANLTDAKRRKEILEGAPVNSSTTGN